jgi:hypothetical protein
MVRSLTESVRAVWNLSRLLLATRGRWRGAYWRWRYETAFGRDESRLPPPRVRRKALMKYGAWVGTMRSLRRLRRG